MAKKIMLAGLAVVMVVSWGVLPALAYNTYVEEQAVVERLTKGAVRQTGSLQAHVQEHTGPLGALRETDKGEAKGGAHIGAKTARALAEEIAVLAIP